MLSINYVSMSKPRGKGNTQANGRGSLGYIGRGSKDVTHMRKEPEK